MAANPGRYAGYSRTPPAWAASVGAMIDTGAIVHVCCSKCGLWRLADLERIAEAKGRDFSLWDRKPPCPTPGCGARAFFHGTPARGTPSRPMRV